MATVSLLEMASSIATRNANLLSSEESAAAIGGVIDAAAANGAHCLAGASWAGHAVCGAAVVNSKGSLRLWRSGDPGPVLVVDGVTASWISVLAVQHRLERSGLDASVHVVEIVPNDTVSADCMAPENAGAFTRSDCWRDSAIVA